MAEGGDAERRLAEEEEEKDDDDSSESSDGGERSSRPGFLFGNVSRRLLLRRSEMPDVQAESGYALDRPVNPSFRRCASSLLHESSQADDNQQPAKTADAHDYASMHELATDDAPSEPARDDAVSLYLSQQAGASAHPIPTDPDTGTNAALSSVPLSSPAAPYHARGVMKMQRTFVRDAGPPSLDTAKRKGVPQEKDEYKEQGREGKESKLGDNADAVAATGEEQKSFEHRDAILDWKAPEQSLDEDDDDLQNHAPRRLNERPKSSIHQSDQQSQELALSEDLEELTRELTHADNPKDSNWAGNACQTAFESVEQVEWERSVRFDDSGDETLSALPEPANDESVLESFSKDEEISLNDDIRPGNSSASQQEVLEHSGRLSDAERAKLKERLRLSARTMPLDRPSLEAGWNTWRILDRLPRYNERSFLNSTCLDLNDPTLVFQSHESRQDDDSLLSESLSSIMVSSKAQGRDAQQSEKSEAASAQNKSAIEKALERFRHYNISNDDAYARSSMRERDRLSINESSNHIGVLPDIRHAAPALRLETTPPAATVEGLNNFHRPRAALYPPKMPAKPLPPATMDTDGEHDDDVEASNHIVLYVRSLSSGTDEVIANVRPTEPIESLRSHAPRFFEHLKQDPKLYFLLHMSSDGKSRFRQGRVSDMKSTFKQEKIISGAVIYVVPFDVQVIPKAKVNAVPKPDKPRVPPAAFSQVDNLSVLDGHIYLAEYFEEHPLHVQKSGMGAKRALFYKKENSEDSRGKELAKNTPLQLHEFDLGDRASPFLSPLHPGQYQETLETTLFRAPVYRNEMRTTDFLLVRRSNGRYVIREATAAFAVGYMEPHEEVPSPAQANVEEYYSRRMKVYTHRLVRDQQAANPGSPPSVRAADVLKLFPEDNERPIFRSILNSFTENESTGIHEGNEQELRTLKQGVTASEKELREWLTPERVCCMESMQAGVEMLRRAHVNSAELHSVSPQQVLNTTSQLSQDERLTNACCSVETELLRSPWAQTSEFLRSVEGRVALELSTSMRAAQRTGRLFNYIRKLQRSREEQEKPSETKGAQAGHITGTAADLRKLSMEDAADYMRWLGCSEELIKASKRWDRIDIIRRMSKEAERKEKMRSLDLGRFVRSIKTPFRKQREEQSRNASKLFKRQSCLLAHKSSISSVGKEEDTEGESDSDSGYESIERKRQEALQAQPAKQTELTEEDDEEKAALELRKNLNQSRSGKKIKRLKMTVRRTQQNSAQKKQSSNSDESRADIVLTVDKEVKDAYADALALGDEVAKQKALDVVNARRDMDGEETRLPGVQPMAYAGHVNISQNKVVLKAGNQLMHEVVGERQAGQSTDDDVANRPNKAPRH